MEFQPYGTQNLVLCKKNRPMKNLPVATQCWYWSMMTTSHWPIVWSNYRHLNEDVEMQFAFLKNDGGYHKFLHKICLRFLNWGNRFYLENLECYGWNFEPKYPECWRWGPFSQCLINHSENTFKLLPSFDKYYNLYLHGNWYSLWCSAFDGKSDLEEKNNLTR